MSLSVKMGPPRTAVLAFVGLVSAALPMTGQNLPAQELIEQVVNNEIKAGEQDTSLWMYTSHKNQGGKDEERKVVQTRQGSVWLLVSVDGKPLQAGDREREIRRVEGLQNDSSAMQKAKRSAEQDARKARELLKVIDQAFVFTYSGKKDHTVELAFTPKPGFKPQSREARVLHSMAGTVQIDELEKRLVGISGHMISDVDFGGGLLGHLHKGGTFAYRQSEVASGFWETTLIDVNLKGKALLFKTISEQQHEVRSDFHRVPDATSVAQAVKMLQQQEPAVSNSQ